MKKDLTDAAENPSTAPPERSFSVAFEQMAKLLRSEVKLKDRSTKILSSHSLPISFSNSFKQIARLLRSEIHPSKPPKKRIWKKKSSKEIKTK
jgi:hypothetical protein